MSYLTRHFTFDELVCPCGCRQMGFTDVGLQELEGLRVEYGRPIVPSSAYRCPRYDAVVHKRRHPEYTEEERHGAHTIVEFGNVTTDVPVILDDAYDLERIAFRRGWTGMGRNQKGSYPGRFVHLDRVPRGAIANIPRPRIWSY